MGNRQYITLENAAAMVGKTVDCHKRIGHHYPLEIWQGGLTENYYIVDRNGVSMKIGPNDKIAYDFIVGED